MQGIDLSKFENKRVVIVGDIMLDEFVYTTSDRNSPEYKDAPVLKVIEKKQYLGGAANVALNIKKLKAIPYLAGTVGNDEAAKTIYKLLHDEDITNLYIHNNQRQATTVKTRIFQDKKPVFRIDNDASTLLSINSSASIGIDSSASLSIDSSSAAGITGSGITELVNHFLLKNITDAINNHKPHVLILQDYNKGVLNAASIAGIIALAKQHNMIVCVDPKFDNWNLYKDVDLFKPNKKEFDFISENESESEDDFIQYAKILQENIRFKNLLVTLGSKGNFIFNGNTSQFLHLASQISNPDVCGAGDTVIAVASLGLACGFSLEQIAELSNRAGFIVCQKEHVQPVTIDELS